MDNNAKKLLVIDDDPRLRELLLRYLSEQGFDVDAYADASQLEKRLQRNRPHLLILDLMLPGEDGLSVCRRLRALGDTLPVIMLTARGDEVDRIVGLEMGADDYLPKPFGPRELLARVRAVLRRGQTPSATTGSISFGPFRLDKLSHTLTRDDVEVPLTSGEFNLLRIFVEHPNQVLSRDHLVSLLRGFERTPFDRSIDVRITRLRRKIEAQPEAPIYLRTVWGEGYLFAPRADAPR